MVDWDVAIVGRSYAGLSTALTLGRARKATLVIGEGGPRNEAVRHVHGMLSRDGATPQELIAAGEAELDRYPTVVLSANRVHEVEGVAGHFRIRFGAHSTTARFVVIATGVNDNPPSIPGLAEHWGRGVFTCPFCDGFERADAPWALISDHVQASHVALLLNWTDQLTIYTDDPDGEVGVALKAALPEGWAIESLPIRRINGDGEHVTDVELVDGTRVPTAAVFVGSTYAPNNRLAAELGCTLDGDGFIVADEQRHTTVDRVYAVGDVTRLGHNLTWSIADGITAGVAITRRLLPH
jgi:thioredoxin reductase